MKVEITKQIGQVKKTDLQNIALLDKDDPARPDWVAS
jgi:hypothetical protein